MREVIEPMASSASWRHAYQFIHASHPPELIVSIEAHEISRGLAYTLFPVREKGDHHLMRSGPGFCCHAKQVDTVFSNQPVPLGNLLLFLDDDPAQVEKHDERLHDLFAPFIDGPFNYLSTGTEFTPPREKCSRCGADSPVVV
jgi:hypothetical protein